MATKAYHFFIGGVALLLTELLSVGARACQPSDHIRQLASVRQRDGGQAPVRPCVEVQRWVLAKEIERVAVSGVGGHVEESAPGLAVSLVDVGTAVEEQTQHAHVIHAGAGRQDLGRGRDTVAEVAAQGEVRAC